MKDTRNILVVDDEPTSSLVIAELLKSVGYTVTTVADGFKAIASCRVRPPELILLDLTMPLLSGMDVYNRLRNEERTHDIPVIFLVDSHKSLQNAKDQLPTLDDYLIKPPEAHELIEKVKMVLRLKDLQDAIKHKEEDIRSMSLVDPHTSSYSTRYLNEFLKTELVKCRRYAVPFSIIVIQLDKHKELLRLLGQPGIDHIIAELASILSDLTRQSDVLARLGPIEFASALTHTAKEGALQVAERLRSGIANHRFTWNDMPVQVTASIGIHQFNPAQDDQYTSLVSQARSAVVKAIASGGNKTVMSQ